MADDHHSLRVPRWLWEQYADVVGNIGRAPDLKDFIAWRLEDPDVALGPDVDPPHDFLTTFRFDPVRWELFIAVVGESKVSAEIRRYIRWRIEHPSEPLPGHQTPPSRRHMYRPAYA